MTQAELAKLLDVSKEAIGNYENATSHPKEPILLKIMEVLEVDANFLFQDVVNFKQKKHSETDVLATDFYIDTMMSNSESRKNFLAELEKASSKLDDEDWTYLARTVEIMSTKKTKIRAIKVKIFVFFVSIFEHQRLILEYHRKVRTRSRIRHRHHKECGGSYLMLPPVLGHFPI